MGDAESGISDSIDKIVQLLDPPEQSVVLQDLAITLTSISADLEALSSSVNDFSDILNTAIQSESGIKGLLFPTGGDPQSQLYQMADLHEALSIAIRAARGNLKSTIEGVMRDETYSLHSPIKPGFRPTSQDWKRRTIFYGTPSILTSSPEH